MHTHTHVQFKLYEETAAKLCAVERERKARMMKGLAIKRFLKDEAQLLDAQADEVCVCVCVYVYSAHEKQG